jgi:hypothetical protein
MSRPTAATPINNGDSLSVVPRPARGATREERRLGQLPAKLSLRLRRERWTPATNRYLDRDSTGAVARDFTRAHSAAVSAHRCGDRSDAQSVPPGKAVTVIMLRVDLIVGVDVLPAPGVAAGLAKSARQSKVGGYAMMRACNFVGPDAPPDEQTGEFPS